MKVFSVFDSKVGKYLRPFFQQESADGIRSFQVSCEEPQSSFAKWPADYSLFEIAEFDIKTGQFKNYQAPFNLGTALQFKVVDPNQMPLPFAKSADKALPVQQ